MVYYPRRYNRYRRNRRRNYRRATYKPRVSRGIVRVTDDWQMSQHKDTVSKFHNRYDAYLTGGGVTFTTSWDIWNCASIPNVVQYKALYDQYKVVGAKLTLIPFFKDNTSVGHSALAMCLDRDTCYDGSGGHPFLTYDAIRQYSVNKLGTTQQAMTLTYKPKGITDPQKTWKDCATIDEPNVDPEHPDWAASFNLATKTLIDNGVVYYLAVIERVLLFRGVR